MATKKKSIHSTGSGQAIVTVHDLVGKPSVKKTSSVKKKVAEVLDLSTPAESPEEPKKAAAKTKTQEIIVEAPVVDTPKEEVAQATTDAPSASGQPQEETGSSRRIHIGGDDSYRPNNNRSNNYSSRGDAGSSQGNYGNRPSFSRNPSNQAGRPDRERDTMQGPTEVVTGFLDIQPEGHGFLRPKFIPSSRDIYISQSQIRRFMLRAGDQVEGVARPPKDTERYYGLLKVEKVNGTLADESMKRPHFDDLTAIYPDRQVILSSGKTPLSTRVIDLVAPIGFGQRGMIVSPPKAGKTTILKEIAAGISANFPDAHLMAALIGERPEEVTDISMSVKGEVVASNFDEPPENQTRVAEITLERAKRMVELGKDVIILLDSITRLARAYNLVVDPSGRTLSGGFDPGALYPAKKFFGAARNAQEGGSLTIIGTALIETGSRMDDLIYEEFKGTGNMELHLVRALAERRIFPAISIERSGTRGEEKILSEDKLKKIVTMRRMMDMLDGNERTAMLVEQLTKAEDNDKFLEALGGKSEA
ncbi:MAG TPA: transcription termination factor Rho [Xanthomonadales bacterium]|nr:transcription termination factor Rho [Xanthomonadales bacterium]